MKQPTALLNPSGEIERLWERDTTEMGPVQPPPRVPEGYVYVDVPEMLVLHTPPTPTCVPRVVAGAAAWVETATLEELKVWKNAAITQAKIAANEDRFEYMGESILVNEASFREMLSTCGWVAMTQTMPPNWPGGWKAIGNDYVPIPDVAGWIDFYGTMVQTGLANFSKSQLMKQRVRDATTVAEVLAINWISTGGNE